MNNAFSIVIATFCNIILVNAVERPIIGILAQEFEPKYELSHYPATSCIPTIYVKGVEAGGARVVPIFIRQDESYYEKILNSVNGVVFPGGNTELQPGYGYYDAVTIIYRIVKKINDKGIYFPILGVCNGFEALLITSNNHSDIQTNCNIRNRYYPLILESNYRQSLTFSHIPEELVVYYKYFDVTGHYHIWCTTPSNFSSSGLSKEWAITATSYDERGLKFISTFEHKIYPIIAVQFHPERHFSEWFPQDTKKYSRANIKANQYFYDLLVDLSKLNQNHFENETVTRKALIYNYSPVYVNNNSNVQWYEFK